MVLITGQKLLSSTILSSVLLSVSCSENIYDEMVRTRELPEQPISGQAPPMGNDSIGRVNAVKKAYQMTDLEYVPLLPLEYNTGTFSAGQKVKGLIYSSVKEIETYVGENVSFHTFMTAVNNPRSVLYTEHVNQWPYHGVNCKAYYGTVCSGMVSYALGLDNPRLNSADFPESPLMKELTDYSPESLCLADVLWKKGHVALITNLMSGDDGLIKTIEYCEAIGSCCKKRTVSRTVFLESTMVYFTNIYRYQAIARNTAYVSANEFVAVGDEVLTSFVYNDALCANKGDKACYFEGEKVVVNILTDVASKVEIYRDDILYDVVTVEAGNDISLTSLPYGDYKARVVYSDDCQTGITPVLMGRATRSGEETGQCSAFTYWKVVNGSVTFDRSRSRLYFSSMNATPNQIVCCKQNGSRPLLSKGYYRVLTSEDLQRGYVDVDLSKMSMEYPFVQVLFSTDYGNIIHKPINWYE